MGDTSLIDLGVGSLDGFVEGNDDERGRLLRVLAVNRCVSHTPCQWRAGISDSVAAS